MDKVKVYPIQQYGRILHLNKEMRYQAKVKQMKSQEERGNVSNAEDVCSLSSSAVYRGSLSVNVRPHGLSLNQTNLAGWRSFVT